MTYPSVSIVTPTYQREEYLARIYRCIKSQTHRDWEWIVLDDSSEPSKFALELNDPSVIYKHLDTRLSIGAKRNLGTELARAQYIVHFDDDEYYAPHYIETMLELLQIKSADIIKLSGFYIFSQIYQKYAYWNLFEKTGFHMAWSTQPMTAGFIEDHQGQLDDNHLGYGFSYVYHKRVAESVKFKDVFFNEDAPFIKEAIAKGFNTQLMGDEAGLCIHVLHEHNTSQCFPQYLIPAHVMRHIFKSLPPELCATAPAGT